MDKILHDRYGLQGMFLINRVGVLIQFSDVKIYLIFTIAVTSYEGANSLLSALQRLFTLILNGHVSNFAWDCCHVECYLIPVKIFL